jgi:hypothetical protein
LGDSRLGGGAVAVAAMSVSFRFEEDDDDDRVYKKGLQEVLTATGKRKGKTENNGDG